MVGRNIGHRAKWVIVDLNTQVDFLSETGARPVTNASQLVPAIRHVVAWTKRNHVPVISSVDSHREGEVGRDGPPTCCIDGSGGQQKLLCTLLGTSIRIEGDNTLSVPVGLFAMYQQVIFRQRTRDLFGNPKADRFLTQLSTPRFILFGVAVETWVKSMALGLLARNRDVTVISDGCGFWSKSEAEFALRQMEAKGARLITVAELLSRKLPRTFRYPHRTPLNGNGRGLARGRRNGTRIEHGKKSSTSGKRSRRS